MTRVAVETLAVSSSRSECIVRGSRFTVSTLMSSFLRVTSLRPGTRRGCYLLASGQGSPAIPTPLSLVVTPSLSLSLCPGMGRRGLWPWVEPALTAFAAPVEEERQGDEEEDEQDARADGGPGDDAHREHLCQGGKQEGRRGEAEGCLKPGGSSGVCAGLRLTESVSNTRWRSRWLWGYTVFGFKLAPAW